jgi:hypothetical protein
MNPLAAAFTVLSLRASVMADSGYGAPSGGYSAPSSGYGAPSSGYGAPSSGYGAPSYRPSYGAATTVAADGGLDLGALLVPLGVGALGLLGLAALTLPVTTTLTGRKKRSADLNVTDTEYQASLLSSYLQNHGFQQNFDLQKEMIASYLECGGSGRSTEVSSCLQRLVCNYHDKSVRLEAKDRDVAAIIIRTVMDNNFISKEYKHVLLSAGRRGSKESGTCHVFHCINNMFSSG